MAEERASAEGTALSEAAPPAQSEFELAFTEVFGTPAFSGRFCEICQDTTPHVHLRGKYNKTVKQIPLLCAPCLQPGGALYALVENLMNRQGEPTPP